jgi:hypothetical protein
MNTYGTTYVDRGSRRILAAMIVCGAALTVLSFAMQLGTSNVKSQLQGLVTVMSGSEAPSR